MMKKFFTLLVLLFASYAAMAQSQYFYEWKGDVITVRTVSELDSLNFPSSDCVANFATGFPSSLTASRMTASYSLLVAGIVPIDLSKTEIGVCYSFSNPVPTVDDYKVRYGTLEEGTWEMTLRDLYSSTLYHYCPYLILGDMVYYGPIKSFTTLNHSTSSIWDLLENRSDLSKFREIVAKAPFYRTDACRAYAANGSDTIFYTFKDVLDAQSDMTLWAPANSALSEEEWARFKAMAENGDYLLQLQLMGNHMAMGSKAMCNSGKGSIQLLNGKTATFDYSASEFQNVRIVEHDISARNGVMHILNGVNEYKGSLYEYIKYSGEANTFKEYLVQRDSFVFMPGLRIEGLPDVDGNPAYVDSVCRYDNFMFSRASYDPTGADSEGEWMNAMKMFNADINAEDSAYVMIVPTDRAWEEARTRLAPYYKFADTYPRMNRLVDNPESKIGISIDKAQRGFLSGLEYGTVDSLQKVNMDMDIIYPLVFNARTQRGNKGKPWRTAQDFMDGYENCEYLLTTTGDTIRDIKDENGTVIWYKKSLFENGRVELKEMSNGIAILTDSWNYGHDYWMRDIDIEANYPYKKVDPGTEIQIEDINNTVAAEWIDNYGRCSEQSYLHVLKGDSYSDANSLVFRLEGSKFGQANVMSARYDIQIVVVPNWYENSEEEPEKPTTIAKNRFRCMLYYWDENTKDNSSYGYAHQEKLACPDVEYDNDKVDTLTLLEDFQFPVSYRNQRYAYPLLEVKTYVSRTEDRRGTYTNEYKIDKIILKCKETE